MKIDIKPEIRLANDFEKIILEMRGIPAIYHVISSDGKQFSTMFDDKSLAEFLPNRTVSETLKNWQDGIKRQIELYSNSIKSNIHPYWTRTVKTMVHYPQYAGRPELEYRWNGKYHEEPQQMTRDQKKFFQSEIKRLELISGEMVFEKVVLKLEETPQEWEDRFFRHPIYDMIEEVVSASKK